MAGSVEALNARRITSRSLALTAPTYNLRMARGGGADRLRIGEFQLDLQAGELRTGTGKVILGSQPFRILEMLARRPAEVVTRREIREALWPDGTVVEFEHSINVAIRRLRSTFDWPAGAGIETVRGRGYRLNAPVTPERRMSSVAVLPFASDGPVMAFFSERLTESLTNHLAGLGRLRVVPRVSAMRQRAKDHDFQSLGHDLGARAVVTGRVAQNSGHVVACVELVDLATESQVWGARFRRRGRNLCLMRANLSRAIFQRLCEYL